MTTPMLVTERSDDVVLIGLNRPEKHNALNASMVRELEGFLSQLRQRPCVLVLHSTTPGVFAAGADIAELVDRDADAALLAINAHLFDSVADHRWPTIAAIDGPAIGGGCELALACDFRVASTRATFAQPELMLGIMAGAGANWRLPDTVGLPLARRMLLSGHRLDAAAALGAGLVDSVHDPADVLAEATRLAGEIAKRSWRALELTKLALRSRQRSTQAADLAMQALLFESSEKRERMSAFLERKGVATMTLRRDGTA